MKKSQLQFFRSFVHNVPSPPYLLFKIFLRISCFLWPDYEVIGAVFLVCILLLYIHRLPQILVDIFHKIWKIFGHYAFIYYFFSLSFSSKDSSLHVSQYASSPQVCFLSLKKIFFWPHTVWGLSSPIRDQTLVHGRESMEY